MEQYYYIAGSLYFTIKLIMLVIPSLPGGNKLSNNDGINDMMGNMMPIIDLLFKSN